MGNACAPYKDISARSTQSHLMGRGLQQEALILASGYGIHMTGMKLCVSSISPPLGSTANPPIRTCQAILQGHTSLVGQLQMRSSTLVTGGSDGSVRVWSLASYTPIHRLAAHDNSVTSLQFDDSRIVSGGSDGRVKIWDLDSGALIRELSQPAEAVWRVAFERERCVVMASRGGRTVMEVWDFTPPGDGDGDGDEDGDTGAGVEVEMTDPTSEEEGEMKGSGGIYENRCDEVMG